MGKTGSFYQRGLVYLAAANLFWSLTPIAVLYISRYTGAHVQNAVRYLSGGTVLLAMALASFWREFAAALRAWPRLLPAALFLICFQTAMVRGINLILPAAYTLIDKSVVIWTMLISILFLPEERSYIKRPLYLAGTALAILGLIGVILGRQGLDGRQASAGVLYTLAGSFFWSLYATYTQKMLKDLEPIASLSAIITGCGLIFLGLAWAWEDPSGLLSASPAALLLLAATGVFCIGVAQALYVRGMRWTGVAMAANISLATPFATALWSYLIYRDSLSAAQLGGGLLLAAGIYLAAQARRETEQGGVGGDLEIHKDACQPPST